MLAFCRYLLLTDYLYLKPLHKFTGKDATLLSRCQQEPIFPWGVSPLMKEEKVCGAGALKRGVENNEKDSRKDSNREASRPKEDGKDKNIIVTTDKHNPYLLDFKMVFGYKLLHL